MPKNEKCFECGRFAGHRHHVVPKTLGGKKTVPLCFECHGKVHSPGALLDRTKMMKGRRKGKIAPEDLSKVWAHKGKYPSRMVAAKFGVSHATVCRFWNREDANWRYWQWLKRVAKASPVK